VIIEETTAICRRCGVSHPARLERSGNLVHGVVCCPEGETRTTLSTNAELFLELRARSATDLDRSPEPGELHYVLNYISITNACNMQCAVCGADARTLGSEKCTFLPIEEIVRRAREVREHGGRILHLFGGEPTLHPEILEIVDRLSSMGFSLGVVTNGLRLGDDPTFARQLKDRGLARICMQFDSLNPTTLAVLGRDHLEQKRRAIKNTLREGLKIGLNCTVADVNLNELGALLRHGLELGAGVHNMTFASAASVGRYDLAEPDAPDRESMLEALTRVGDRFGFSMDDVLPMPAFRPWGLQVHPECGAHVVLVRTPTGIHALNRLVDLPGLYRRSGRSRLTNTVVNRNLVPAMWALRAVRPGQLARTLHFIAGLVFRRPGYGLVNVGVSNYRGAMFLDERRIERCASAFYTSTGPVKSCVHFLGRQDVPGSREHESMRPECPVTA
jgi:hypothetical protein